MLMAVTFLTLLTGIPYGISVYRSCVPNTQFLLNGKLCYCNSLGQSRDSACQMIGLRKSCTPGQIIWEECSQCICQDNGKLLCTNSECNDEVIKIRSSMRTNTANWCTPFRSYYVNCTLCVCPASGKMSEAPCAKDSACSGNGPVMTIDTVAKNICIPKVMYLYPCLNCMCSDDGVFHKSKCIETCQHSLSSRRCIPKTFYRSGCNICRCPDNGTPDSTLCTKTTCHKHFKLNSLNYYRNKSFSCIPNTYTKPKCMYCECNSLGVVNENSCLEHECLKVEDFDYETVKSTCSPGELVATCMECFCPRSRLTIEKYCTRVCSPQNKLVILESVLKRKVTLIDRTLVKETAGTDSCEPNALFLDQGRYCLCSDNGNTNFKHCSSVLEDRVPKRPSKIFGEQDLNTRSKIDFNFTCEPNTYVEFGCNSCYCTKSGKIDAKWCTNDDCEIKKLSSSRSKIITPDMLKVPKETDSTSCVPGSITKDDCNFCICGPNGLLADRACTKNVCSRSKQQTKGNEFTCEPLAYYTVDCNMCYCPSDGIKNVEKCTKNQCEANFLRAETCTPGELFSNECNICVCPPNGDKADKICSNRTCSENDTPWKKIFKISESLLSNHLAENSPKNLQPCYPGEEFEEGCKVCICPEMGLKEYASCSGLLCNELTTLNSMFELE